MIRHFNVTTYVYNPENKKFLFIFHKKLNQLCKKIQEKMGYNDQEIRTLTSHIYNLNGYCLDSTKLTKDNTLSNYELLINQRKVTGLCEGPGHASNETPVNLKKMIWVIDKLIAIDEKFTQELLTSQPASRLTALRIDDTPTHPLSIINFHNYLGDLPFQNFTSPKVEDIRTTLIDGEFSSCDDLEFLRNLLFHFKENPHKFPEIEDIKTQIIELVANNLNSQTPGLQNPSYQILNQAKESIHQEFSKCDSFKSISKNPLDPAEIISLNTDQQQQFFEILHRKIDDLALMISNNSQNFQSQVASSGIFDIKDLRNKCRLKFQKIKREFDENALAKQNHKSK